MLSFVYHLTALCVLDWLENEVVPWLRGDEWLHKGCEGIADRGKTWATLQGSCKTSKFCDKMAG